MVVDLPPEDPSVDRAFQALADPTRRDIVRFALQHEPSVSALARRYPISVTAVQKHVTVLERAELVSTRRRGRERIVRTEVAALRRARAALDQLEAVWRQRIATIDQMLQHPDDGGA
jgi:DNA-binding transcriptional ArsR family regulator